MFDPSRNHPSRHTHRGPRLVDPYNVNSQLGPEDFIIPEYNPSIDVANPKLAKGFDHDERVLRMMTDRITSGINYKRVKEPKWYESLAFYLGAQDMQWNYASRQLTPARSARNVHKIFAMRNKIRPKIKKVTYLAFCQKPDAAIKGRTTSDLDRQATTEARDILSHCDYKFHRDHQVRRIGHWAQTTSTCALKFGWNEKAAVEMPKFDGDGNIIGSEIVENQGEIFESIVPVFELLMDPEAREYDEMAWIIHQKVQKLSHIREQYENGVFVAPDAGQGIAGYVESRLAAVLGEYMRGSEPGPVKNNSAVVFECFEPPSDLYPDGRMIVCTQNVLLRYEECWPNMDAKELMLHGIRVPYAFLSYEECPGSLYGLNAVSDMISPQKTINNCISREEEHLATAWGKLMIEQGSLVDPRAFDDARPNEKITYKRGMAAPEHVDPPALPEWVGAMKTQAEEDLDDISGLHEVSGAEVPAGVESGEAISQLKAADNMGGSIYASNIEEFHRQRATLEIHIVGRNYIEPRLMFISTGYFGDPGKKLQIPGVPNAGNQGPQAPTQVPMSSGGMQVTPGMIPQAPQMPPPAAPPMPPFTNDPDTAVMDVRSFRALQNGGSCHVVITPGSALAKDTDARKREVMALFKEGLFGPPGDPTTAGIVLSLLEYAGSDEIVEAARAAAMQRLRFQLAMAPDPATLQAQQQTHQQQLAQIKVSSDAAIEQAKQAHEGATLALKSQLDQEKLQRETDAALAVKTQEQYFDLHQALLNKLHPDLRLVGNISPVEAAAAMATIGFPTPDMPALAKTAEAEANTASASAQSAQQMADAPPVAPVQAGVDQQAQPTAQQSAPAETDPTMEDPQDGS